MDILSPTRFNEVRSLFDSLDDHLAVCAILEGAAPGRVYVDDPAKPRAAFAWTHHRFFLAGDPGQSDFNQAVGRLFADTIYPQAPDSGLEMFELCYASAAWEPVIETVILSDKAPMKARRHHYQLTTPKQTNGESLPAGFRLVPITSDLLAQKDLARLGELLEELCSERPSVEEFLARSFGVCALYDNTIAGWCTSEYNSGDRCEVGIGTLPPYRRRGITTAMGRALIELAQARGITRIGWHCWADNAGSIATALKIGFNLTTRYPTYIAWFDEADNLMINGDEPLRRGEYERALAWYQKAIGRGIAHRGIYWSAGCAAAGLGQTSAALDYLEKAVESGFSIMPAFRTHLSCKTCTARRAGMS